MKNKVLTILISIICVSTLSFGFLVFYMKTNDFGLSKEAINRQKNLTPEETIRLYLYYDNRHDDSITDLLQEADDLTFSVEWYEDIRIISIEEVLTENQPNEWNVYEVKTMNVKFNHTLLIAQKSENEDTIDVDFKLIKEKQDSEWKILAIGNGI